MGCFRSRPAAVAPQADPLAGVTTSNEDIRDKYEFGRVLGSGSFGQVREAKLKVSPTEIRAVKMIERDNEDGEWSNKAIFVREVGLLKQINHPNIIQYFDVYADDDFLYVVMELCQGGEVFAKIIELKRFAEQDAAVIGKQMLLAIKYIHSINIIHRDIKAENFMLERPTWPSPVKMIDFGMACKYEDGEIQTELCGSPHYLAPELIGQRYNQLVDVWAFGVLMYLIMYGRYPYDSKQARDIMVKIVTEPIQWSTKVKLSSDASRFLKRLLEPNPRRRLNAAQALEQSWIVSRTAETSVEAEAPPAEVLPTEVVRSAHRKVTAQRKQVDPKVEQVRNKKLKKIDEDYSRGIARGKRLGDTSKQEDFLNKPEFMRRENKLVTAPSNQVAFSQSLAEDAVDRGHKDPEMVPERASEPVFVRAPDEEQTDCSSIQDITPNSPRSNGGDNGGASSSTEQRSAQAPVIKQRRCQSLCHPKRLSYIGHMTSKDEKNLHNLYTERNSAPAAIDPDSAVPETVPEIRENEKSFNSVVATQELS